MNGSKQCPCHTPSEDAPKYMQEIYSGTYSDNGTDDSEGGSKDVDPDVALIGNSCFDGCSLVE